MSELTNAERETIIRRSADEKHWDCYSCVPADVRRLRRLAASWGAAVTEMPYDGIRCVIPVTSAESLGPKKKPREKTETEKRAMRERLKKARERHDFDGNNYSQA